MPDREHELERELKELGSHIEYPPTPNLARAVRRSLDQVGMPPRSRRFWSSWPSLLRAVAAVALVLIIAVPALSPTMRATVIDRFEAGQTATSGRSTGGAQVSPPATESQRKPAPLSGQEAETGESSPDSAQKNSPLGEHLGIGERITLQEARIGSEEGTPLLLPHVPMLGDPDEVYAVEPPREEGVVLVYRTRPGLPPIDDSGVGLVLIEIVGDVESSYLPEGARSDTALETAKIGGNRGYWIPAGHDLPSRIGRIEQLHGSILLWKQDGRAILLEASFPKEKEIRIAESVH